jgi:selenocysteine lyase/cysteine desulfurase
MALASDLNLHALLADEGRRLEEFPVTRSQVFLAHAAVCPLPRRVQSAMHRCVDASGQSDQDTAADSARLLRETRVLGARLLGATPEEVALVGPTSLALSYVAAGLDFQPGDEVLVHGDDYPSNVYPWLALRERGVKINSLRPPRPGQIGVEEVTAALTPRTRLVALASCHFLSGYRVDVEAVGALLRSHGVLFCVDAIQTLGAFPLRVQHIDFLAADAHKWLLGPCGAGLLYVRREVQPLLRPVAWGWHNVRCPGFIAVDPMVLRPDARRYEAGTQSLVGYAGLRAALEWLEELGPGKIEQAILDRRQWLANALASKGWEVLHLDVPPQHQSGIVTARRPGQSMEALQAQLAAQGIIVSLRHNRAQEAFLRFSPHAYNSRTELERAVAAL